MAKGYLRVDGAGNLRLPAVQHLGEIDLNAASPTQVNAPVEYQLHNLSDADFTQTGPSVAVAQMVLVGVVLVVLDRFVRLGQVVR